MSFYSIYLVEGSIELYALEHEQRAIAQQGRLIATYKGYQQAWEAAVAIAQKKQLPMVDRAKPIP